MSTRRVESEPDASPRTSWRSRGSSAAGSPSPSPTPSRSAPSSSTTVLGCVVAEGHILIEDLPGVGKTTLARAVARAIDLQFARVQCTADLLPADVVGTNVFNQREDRFEFGPGPIFANVVPRRRDQPRLAQDAIGPARVHAGAPRHRGRALPRARAPVRRPGHAEPRRVRGHLPAARGPGRPLHGPPVAGLSLRRRRGRHAPPPRDRRPRRRARPRGHRRRAPRRAGCRPPRVTPPTPLRAYVVALLHRTRQDPRAELGASPRAGLLLLRAAKARALLPGRDHALPDDVQALAAVVLAHRIVLAPEAIEATRRAHRRRRPGGDAGAVGPRDAPGRRPPRSWGSASAADRGDPSTPSRSTWPAWACCVLAGARRCGWSSGARGVRMTAHRRRTAHARGASRSASTVTSPPAGCPCPAAASTTTCCPRPRRWPAGAGARRCASTPASPRRGRKVLPPPRDRRQRPARPGRPACVTADGARRAARPAAPGEGRSRRRARATARGAGGAPRAPVDRGRGRPRRPAPLPARRGGVAHLLARRWPRGGELMERRLRSDGDTRPLDRPRPAPARARGGPRRGGARRRLAVRAPGAAPAAARCCCPATGARRSLESDAHRLAAPARAPGAGRRSLRARTSRAWRSRRGPLLYVRRPPSGARAARAGPRRRRRALPHRAGRRRAARRALRAPATERASAGAGRRSPWPAAPGTS